MPPAVMPDMPANAGRHIQKLLAAADKPSDIRVTSPNKTPYLIDLSLLTNLAEH